MTLVELLCALAVVLLVSAGMVLGVSLAVRSYERSVAGSEAQVLCSTLETIVSDELRYAGTLKYDEGGKVIGFFAKTTPMRTTSNPSLPPMTKAGCCWAGRSCCPTTPIPTGCGPRWS